MTLARSFTSSSSLIVLSIATLIIHATLIDETTSRQTMQLLQFTLGECGPEAVVEDNCYYFRNNIRYANEPVDLSGPVAAIVDFDRQLKKQNIRLLVVPVPSKISINWNNHTTSFIEALHHMNVETIDLRLDNQSYLRTDTHWNSTGIDHAARTIAHKLGSTKQIAGEDVLVLRHGDIVEMFENQTIKNVIGPEPIICKQFNLQNGSGVLFMGDSYLRIFELDKPGNAGLISMVGSYLGYRPRSIINDGGGSTLVRQRLAIEPELLIGTKTVIWVFADRDIRFGIDGWQQIAINHHSILSDH